MRSFGLKFMRTRKLDFSAQMCLVIKRFRKQFASLHSQEKKLYVFPNTPLDQLSLPAGIGVCNSVADFKIKALKGGFQRRPELIVSNNALSFHIHDETWSELTLLDKWSSRFDKNKRVQKELVEKAVSLCCDIGLKIENNEIDMERIKKNEKNKLVLDIGCGDGTSTKPLLDMGYSCVGVDLNLRGLSEFQMSCLRWRKPFQNRDKMCDVETIKAQRCKCYEACSSSINFSASNTGRQKIVNEMCFCSCRGSSQNSFIMSSNAKYISAGFADVIRWDLRHGLPFRAGTFDMAISISFLQWLFYGDRQRQLNLFFSSLKSLLQPQGKAVVQFYPMNASQLTDAIHYAMKHFQGVLVGDYPHVDRGRKLFLVMFS